MKPVRLLIPGFLVLAVSPGIVRGQFGRPIPLPRPVNVPNGFHGVPHGKSDGDELKTILAGLGIGGAVVGVYYLGKGVRNWLKPAPRIRVTGVPRGEAPEWVRRAWVGLELPLARSQPQSQYLNTVEVLSQEAGPPVLGYIVNGKEAIRCLESGAPEAAAWWRENAPQVLKSGYQLIFPAEACEGAGEDSVSFS